MWDPDNESPPRPIDDEQIRRILGANYHQVDTVPFNGDLVGTGSSGVMVGYVGLWPGASRKTKACRFCVESLTWPRIVGSISVSRASYRSESR